MRWANHADLVLLNDPTNLELFRTINPNTHYLPHAYDPKIHHPGTPAKGWESDFCFVGTGYPSRIRFFEAVDFDGIRTVFAGNWTATTDDSPLREFVPHDIGHCLDNGDTVKLYRGTKASANLYRREGITSITDSNRAWAMGPREVELAATGTFYLTEARAENRDVLPMVPTFEHVGDFEEQLRWWLAHDDERTDVAHQARQAISARTFAANAQQMLTLVG